MDLQIPRLDHLPPTCQEPLHNKIVTDYNEIMKPNDFRHLCDNVCSKEVFLLCFVKFIALALFQCWKKKDIKKTDPGVSLVSSDYESEVPGKK